MAPPRFNPVDTVIENGATRAGSPDHFLNPSEHVVVIVDPYSTGCLLAQETAKRGYHVVALWTKDFPSAKKSHVPSNCGKLNWMEQIDQANTLEDTASVVHLAAGSKGVVACIAGGEEGIEFADALSEHLGLRTNGTHVPHRRNKKIQQEMIRKNGLRSARQAAGSKFEDIESFLKTEPYPVVLKTIESVASGVKLCQTFEDAKEHFEVLMNLQATKGVESPTVLCQEYLSGKEYVVDNVSQDGRHVTTMLWRYDNRPCNGSASVSFGCIPVDSNTPEAKILLPYTRAVLDALDVKNGPSHAEIMMTEEGPCLIEMNCRAHGGDGAWRQLCKALTGGYSQIETTIDAYLDDDQFKRVPDKPPSPFKSAGQEVSLVSYSRGKVQRTPGYDVVQILPSFASLERGVKSGSEVDYTVDSLTGIGSVILINQDKDALKRDIELIRYLEQINGLFVYEARMENLKRPRGENAILDSIKGTHRSVFSADGPSLFRHMSNDRPDLKGPLVKHMTTVDASKELVVLTDPYSTGCLVAEEIHKRGYQIMALWTRGFAPIMKTHVPMAVKELNYHAEVEEAETDADTAAAIFEAAGEYRVVGCIAGGEAGVDVADRLSEYMKLRSNGTRIPDKRDKKIQQELIRKHGLRSIRQACGTTFAEVENFLVAEDYPVVLKPLESAGSDGVKLCHSFEEAKAHFELLMKSEMVNGGLCPAVLCQEFLRGKEYVVDHVSRDGVHKTMMLWVYDKKPANGSAFVYFGMNPVDSESPEAKILIPYVRRVLDALDLKNGPSHAEIMMTNDGPCLVEMNCRAHGGDGNWRPLCLALTGGYSQVEVAVDSYLDARTFSLRPDKPCSPYKAFGREIDLVSYSRGKVKSCPGFEEIQKLQSFVYLETGVKPGSFVEYTTDLITATGGVILMHKDEDVVNRDIETIRRIEKEDRMFVYESTNVLLRSKKSTDNVNRLAISSEVY